MLRLEGSGRLDADVLSLLVVELGQLHTKRLKVQTGHLLIKMLGQHVHAERVTLGMVEELDLGDHLVGELATHHKARVACRAAKVHQSTLSKDDHLVAVVEAPHIRARLELITHCS